MTAINKLRDLFKTDFAVDVDFDSDSCLKIVNLFKEVRDLGIEYKIDEVFKDTWMSNAGNEFSLGGWNYFGMKDGATGIHHNDWGDHDALNVSEFEVLVNNAKAEIAIPLTLRDNVVITGGVVVVNYKDGSSFHLKQDGKATLDVENRVVTTEHTFLKDGQPAYERVSVKLQSLVSVESDTLKLTVIEDGAKVGLTTTFTL